MSTQEKVYTLEARVRNLFKRVLDINPGEIKPDARLDQSLGIDSTEMVEITVGLKKEFGVSLTDNELRKTQTLNEIITVLKTKGLQ